MKSARLKLGFGAVLLLCFAEWSLADLSYGSFPENYEVRVKFKDLIFGPKNEAFAFSPTIEPPRGGRPAVSVTVERQNGSFYLLFTNEEYGDYPLFSAGSYIIRKDLEKGDFTQIKVFLSSDPGTYIRITPLGTQSRVDVILLDRVVYQNVVLPVPIEQVALEPFANIMRLTSFHIDWDLLAAPEQRPSDRRAESMVSKLRDQLGMLKDSDDGAMDAGGTFRLIEDLTENLQSGFNCSGFAKWVVDGLFLPRTGGLLPIEPLKIKHPDRRGTSWSDQYEELRDPYFGLDWSRNLATEYRSLAARDEVDIEATDVRYVPFHTYVEDVGYPVDDIELVLYMLARQDPGYFYLGSISRDFGSDPVLKQHVHVLVLFPFFDSRGRFKAVVMERNLETSLDSLIGRYAGDNVHLVRIAVSDAYTLPSVEFQAPLRYPLLYDFP